MIREIILEPGLGVPSVSNMARLIDFCQAELGASTKVYTKEKLPDREHFHSLWDDLGDKASMARQIRNVFATWPLASLVERLAKETQLGAEGVAGPDGASSGGTCQQPLASSPTDNTNSDMSSWESNQQASLISAGNDNAPITSPSEENQQPSLSLQTHDPAPHSSSPTTNQPPSSSQSYDPAPQASSSAANKQPSSSLTGRNPPAYSRFRPRDRHFQEVVVPAAFEDFRRLERSWCLQLASTAYRKVKRWGGHDDPPHTKAGFAAMDRRYLAFLRVLKDVGFNMMSRIPCSDLDWVIGNTWADAVLGHVVHKYAVSSSQPGHACLS